MTLVYSRHQYVHFWVSRVAVLGRPASHPQAKDCDTAARVHVTDPE